MPIDIDVQIAVDAQNIPQHGQIQQTIQTTLEHIDLYAAEMTVRIVSLEESQQLNHEYRDKNKPTNVLSFPSELPDFVPSNHIGDLVICHEVVVTEAREQQKPLDGHYAHMIVHGTLHCLGFDHIEDGDAEVMETHEIAILAQLGIDDPYNTD
jgi:probable rRNA maturation factor